MGFREGAYETQALLIPEEFLKGKSQGFQDFMEQGFIEGFIE